MGKKSREKREKRISGGSNLQERVQRKTGLEKTCLFIIRWGTYAVLFTPLVISANFFFPFVAPKTFFFRILVEIIVAAYAFLAISNPRRYLPKINPLNIAVFIFLAFFIITSFTGVNLERSFWSTYERMTGIWTMVHLFALFIVLSSVFKKKEDWRNLFGVSVIVGIILSLYVLKGDEISSRGGGTIGNTSFMGAYLLFDIFFAIILFLSERKWWRIFAGAGLVVMVPVLLASTARGAIISFLAGLFLLFLGYLIFSQKKALKRAAIGIIVSLAILGILAAVMQPAFIEDPVKHTLREMKPRFVIWEKAWKGFQERPILGWGPENFNIIFAKYFNPCTFLSECGGEIWFDRAHNIVLDTLVNSGIVGLLSYLAMFAVAIWGLLKTIPKTVNRRNIFIPLGLAVLLAVYFAQNLLVFDMINSYLVFFLVLACASFIIQERKEEAEERRFKIKPIVAVLILLLTVFLLWTTNIRPMMAGHYVIQAISAEYLEDATDYFEKSVDSWMYPYEAREHFSQRMTKAVYGDFTEKEVEEIKKAFVLTEGEMKKAVKENPIDFRQYLFLGQLYNSFYRITGDPEKLDLAEEALNKAIELSPTNQQGYWYLAEVRLARGDIQKTIDLLEQAVELDPRVGNSHWFLAMAYSIAGNNHKAMEHINKAEEAGYNWKKDSASLQRVIAIYEEMGDDQKLISLYSDILELDPSNADYWYSLAASYANMGEYQKAKEAANKVREIDPSASERIDEFINQLP